MEVGRAALNEKKNEEGNAAKRDKRSKKAESEKSEGT